MERIYGIGRNRDRSIFVDMNHTFARCLFGSRVYTFSVSMLFSLLKPYPIRNVSRDGIPDRRISCGLLSIYTSYKIKNKIISNYEYVRNALAHPSYSISDGIMYIDVIENNKKLMRSRYHVMIL